MQGGDGMKIIVKNREGAFLGEYQYPRWFVKNHRWITDFGHEYLLVTLSKQRPDYRVGFVNEKRGRLDQLRYPKSIHIQKEGKDTEEIIEFPPHTHLHSLFVDKDNGCKCVVWETELDAAKI